MADGYCRKKGNWVRLNERFSWIQPIDFNGLKKDILWGGKATLNMAVA